MSKILKKTYEGPPDVWKKSTASAIAGALRHPIFDNAAQANIIFVVSSGKIIMANSAARKLLGYSKKELLTAGTTAIFDINESSFKTLLQQRTEKGHCTAVLTAIRKSGQLLPCKINSAIVKDEDGIETAITAISDISKSIPKQKIEMPNKISAC